MQNIFPQFLKYFFITLFIQISFLLFFAILINTSLGENILYGFYIAPWIALFPNKGEKTEITNLLLVTITGLFALVYSTILSFLILGLREILSGPKLK
jgi:hypothetical protein